MPCVVCPVVVILCLLLHVSSSIDDCIAKV